MSKTLKGFFAFVVFVAIGVSLCNAETIWEKRQKASKDISEKQDAIEETEAIDEAPVIPETTPLTTSQIPLDGIFIPAQYGSIVETHEGNNGNLIIHIQDAHANYEAQKNIANIVETLILDHNINLILKEGGSTDADFSNLRSMAPVDVRKRAAEKLLENATITGEEYLEISSDYPMFFQGIEDRQLYDKNINALWEMDKFRYIALEYINGLTSVATSIKAKIYNNDLLALDKAKKDYENEDMDLLAYYNALHDIIVNKNIGISEFPNFSNLIKINEFEKKIDFAKVNSADASEEEKTVYDEYQQALKNLNVNKLFKEEPLIENKIQKAISDNSGQEELYKIAKALSVMEKMLNIKLVPEEFDYFIKNKSDFDPEAWSNFLKEKSEELGLSLDIPENYYVIKDNMPVIEKFYATAGERDKVFIRKSEERMAKDNVKSAILIAGGFHTPNLTQLLTEKGYSYIVISPKVTVKTDENVYRQMLKRTWLPEK